MRGTAGKLTNQKVLPGIFPDIKQVSTVGAINDPTFGLLKLKTGWRESKQSSSPQPIPKSNE
jgi:hypothetical protein